jgi:hypothetical protein
MSNLVTVPKAIANGSEKIRGVKLVGAVLNDIYRTRVFSERSLSNAFGFKGSGKYWKDRKDNAAVLPPYLSNRYIKEFIDKELEEILTAAVSYVSVSGIMSSGLPANVLPRICDVFVKAAKKYPENENIVSAAESAYEIIMAFSEYGVIKWVDKITGYKYEEEDHVILQQLALYVAPDILEWQQEFKSDFYKEIFRLKGWPYNPYSVSRPGVVGTYTNQYIYSFLPTNVFKFIKDRTPKSKSGNYTVRLHQSLNKEVGKELLRNQLVSVTTILRISKSWEQFKQHFQELYGQTSLDFDEPTMELIIDKKELPTLSEFNQKLKKGLEFNPKDIKKE